VTMVTTVVSTKIVVAVSAVVVVTFVKVVA